MPPLRKTHTIYPFTDDSGTPLGAPGIWFELSTSPGFVGLAKVDWPPVPPNGNPESRRRRFETALTAALQEKCELRIKFDDMVKESTDNSTRPDDDPITRDLAPEPFTRFEDVGKNTVPPGQEDKRGDIETYVVRVVEIFVPVKSINPTVIGAIRVSNAASGFQRV